MLDRRAFHYFVEDIDLKLPAPRASIELTATTDGYAVKVTAETLLKDLCLMADRLDPDGVVDSMLVTLLPKESHIFALRTAKAMSVSDISIGTVLRSANDLVATH